MRINVLRQACCSADDQINRLDAVYEVDSKATMETLLRKICESDFLQYSSTHDRLSVEIDDRQVAEVFPSAPPVWMADIGPETPVKWLVGDRTLHFVFRLKDRYVDTFRSANPPATTSIAVSAREHGAYGVMRALAAFGFAWVALNTVLESYYLDDAEKWLISLLAALAGFIIGRTVHRSKTRL